MAAGGSGGGRLAVLAVLVAAALVAGCTPLGMFGEDEPDKQVAQKAEPKPKPPAPVWKHRTTSFTAVQNIGEVAVLMRAAKGRLYVDALDPATGKRLWTDEASPSLLNRSRPTTVLNVGGKVAYLRPTRNEKRLRARLVIVEPRTGKTLARSTYGWFWGQVERCDNAATAACVRFSTVEDQGRQYRLSVASPKLRRDRKQLPELKRLPEAFPLAAGGLLGSDEKPSGRIGRVVNGKLVWWRKAPSVFGKAASLEAGFDFEYHPDEDVYTGSVNHKGDSETDTWNLAKYGMAGIDGKTGRRLWWVKGVYSNCLSTTEIPVLAGREQGLATPATGTPELPLRCRYRGSLTWHPKAENYTGKKLRAVLERYDIRTGATVWSAPIGAAPVQTRRKKVSRVSYANPTIVDDKSLAVETGGRTVVVDLATGKTSPATTTTPVWCWLDGFAEYKEPIYYSGTGRSSVRIWGGYLSRPCDARAGRGLFTVQSIPLMMSQQFTGGTTVYAGPGSVVAYRTSDLKAVKAG